MSNAVLALTVVERWYRKHSKAYLSQKALDSLADDIQVALDSLAADELLEACKKAKVFIEYARYLLDDGIAKLGDQFPRKGDASAEIKRLDSAIARATRDATQKG
jgi:hypothetical protein